MIKLEILKMAFEKSKTAQEAMALAEQMSEFVNSDKGISPKSNAQTRNGTVWRKHEIDQLRKLYNDGVPEDEIAIALRRNQKAIQMAIYKLIEGKKFGEELT